VKCLGFTLNSNNMNIINQTGEVCKPNITAYKREDKNCTWPKKLDDFRLCNVTVEQKQLSEDIFTASTGDSGYLSRGSDSVSDNSSLNKYVHCEPSSISRSWLSIPVFSQIASYALVQFQCQHHVFCFSILLIREYACHDFPLYSSFSLVIYVGS
jgi:hypothetical protein